jgi:hypothetical protein
VARGNDRGRDFDDQYYGARRRGEYKQARGEGIWADDHRLKHAGEPKPSHSKDQSCGKKAVLLLGFLSGFGWVLSEIVGRAV